MAKKHLAAALGFLIFLGVNYKAESRNTKHLLPIEPALQSNQAKIALKPNDDIKLYFSGQSTPVAQKTFSEIRSNRKTNSVGKSDKTSCEWAFLSAVKALQAKAKEMGANAIIDVKSDYNEKEFASADQFECHAGATVAGVVLKGTPVIIGDVQTIQEKPASNTKVKVNNKK